VELCSGANYNGGHVQKETATFVWSQFCVRMQGSGAAHTNDDSNASSNDITAPLITKRDSLLLGLYNEGGAFVHPVN